MRKYRVYATVVGSKYVGTFEAQNKQAAYDKAWKSEGAYVSFCHQCTDECEDPECREMHVEAAGADAKVDNGESDR